MLEIRGLIDFCTVTTDIRQMSSKNIVLWAELSHESNRIKLRNHARKDLEADGEFRDINRCMVLFLCRVHPDLIKKMSATPKPLTLIQFYGLPDCRGLCWVLCFEWFPAVLWLVHKNPSNHHLDEQQTEGWWLVFSSNNEQMLITSPAPAPQREGADMKRLLDWFKSQLSGSD